MIRLDINIDSINETRWPNYGDFMIDDFKMIYAGSEKQEKGVGLLLDNNLAKCMLWYWTVNERVLFVKLQGHPFYISIIVVYAPTAESTEEEIEILYETLEKLRLSASQMK